MSHILKKLNRTLRPVCDDFQICIQNEGNVWFQKIASKMQKNINIEYQSKSFENIKDKDVV